MRHVSRVSFHVRPPKHGWLPVRLELDEFVLEHLASGVLNDPVESLLDMLAFSVAPTPAGARLCVWLEPDGYAVDLTEGRKPGSAVLRVFYDESFIPPMRRAAMALRFECELDAGELRLALLAGLTGLLESPDATSLDLWRRGRTLATYVARFNSLRAG